MPVLSTEWSIIHGLAIAGLLGLAAWRDVLTRTIPDSISIALLAIGSVIRLSDGAQALFLSWAVAVGLFVILLPLCARGLLGGADLKLLSALAVGLAPQSTLDLLLAVTVCGGVLAMTYLCASRALALWTRRSVSVIRPAGLLPRLATIESWRIRRGAPLPYGVAIAAGMVIVLVKQQGA